MSTYHVILYNGFASLSSEVQASTKKEAIRKAKANHKDKIKLINTSSQRPWIITKCEVLEEDEFGNSTY